MASIFALKWTLLSLSWLEHTRRFLIRTKCIKKKDWHRQTSHYTYVTRARTTRAPPTRPTTTTTTTTTTESPATTSARPDDNEEEEIPFDEEEDDSRSERRTMASNWPDRIDPIPTFWPTSNWWGSIDPIRSDGGSRGGGQSRQSNRIPTYAPPPPNGNNRNRAETSDGRGGVGGSQVARSSSSRPSPPPYLQWLLAGLVQVRMWASGRQASLLLGRRRLLAIVVIVAAASRFQILAWSTSPFTPCVCFFLFYILWYPNYIQINITSHLKGGRGGFYFFFLVPLPFFSLLVFFPAKIRIAVKLFTYLYL